MTDTIFVCSHCGKTTKLEGVRLVEDDDLEQNKSEHKEMWDNMADFQVKEQKEYLIKKELDKDYSLDEVPEQ